MARYDRWDSHEVKLWAGYLAAVAAGFAWLEWRGLRKRNDDNPTLTATVVGQVAGGDAIHYSLDTAATQFSNVGSYAITVTLGSNPNYHLTTTAHNLVIEKADLTVVVDGYLGDTYDSDAHTQTVTVIGVGSNGELFSDSLTGTDAGSYSKPWSYSNGNYNSQVLAQTTSLSLS